MAEYAEKIQKAVVAVWVEQDYRPDGWLASLLRKVKVTVDVSRAQNRETNLQKLSGALKDCVKKM